MKNKVYIDYNYGSVYWSIKDIRRNANLLRRILKKVSDSVILKLANNLKEYFFSGDIDMTEFKYLYNLFNKKWLECIGNK